MVRKDLLEILRCPACAPDEKGILDLYKETWLICRDCGKKYPIVEDIPVMLISEGEKWASFRLEDLPIPPPHPHQ